MSRLILILACLLLAASAPAAAAPASQGLKDVYFGEALYHAYQGEWFDSISRLDTELGQHYGVDEPALDTLYHHLNRAEFSVGDFELAYRMHHRAGRAIGRVIEGNVEEPVRNEAIYRLARIYFQKDQPENALHALERIKGEVPPAIRDDLEFLRAQVFMANGRFAEAAEIFKELQGAKSLGGFAGYNLGISLLKDGEEQDGRQYLDRTGQIATDGEAAAAIRDKSNLVLGYKLLDENAAENAKLVLERVRLSGPFSNRALLGSGWSDASRGLYERALVPWSILAEREVTDPAVQEALLAVPYAYGKLNVYGKAALLYGKALESFGKEVEKLGASITSVREGKFLQALAREELKLDADWVVKLRDLPQAPETYYLLELMASHDFQESLKSYLDLTDLERRLDVWDGDLNAFEEIIGQRRAYYQPLLPEIDAAFRQLDSRMRLRLEQRDRIQKRLTAMLVAPRPDYLATAEERVAREELDRMEAALKGAASLPLPSPPPPGEGSKTVGWAVPTTYMGAGLKGAASLPLPGPPPPGEGTKTVGWAVPTTHMETALKGATSLPLPSPPPPGLRAEALRPAKAGEGTKPAVSDATLERIGRLRGFLAYNIATEYDQRQTDAFKHLADLNQEVELLKKQYGAFVRTRQAATQSYQGYESGIASERSRIAAAREKVTALKARQGNLLEAMAVEELTKRRERLEQFQITARFAIADSYDRAAKAQSEKGAGQ